MGHDDPEFLECTCTHRALREEEKVIYFLPRRADGTVPIMVFAKDCPVHGYTVDEQKQHAENA